MSAYLNENYLFIAEIWANSIKQTIQMFLLTLLAISTSCRILKYDYELKVSPTGTHKLTIFKKKYF